MIQNKKQMFIVIAVFTLILLLGTTTYAFFNYTRTGSANTIKVGRIAFNTNQTKTINLSNVFPIDSSKVATDTENVGKVEITVTGDTDYVGGIEYLITTEETQATVTRGNKIISVPISVNVDVTNLGTESSDYWNARESKNSTIYKKLVNNTISIDQMLLVGYIKPNTTSGTAEGINGKVIITAYIDKDLISISDTYDGTESDENGTTENWVDNRVTLTSNEWNSLQSSGLSFKVKVEANEGIWVIGSLEEIMKKNNRGLDSQNGVDFSKNSTKDGLNGTGTTGVYMRAGTENATNPILYYRGDIKNNNIVFANRCWKGVRTTDTGGVKLIYNGEYGNNYVNVENIPLSTYKNVEHNDQIFSPKDNYTFDSNDNTWNTNLGNYESLELPFSVKNSGNYTLEITGPAAPNSISFSFYKNGSLIFSTSVNPGSPFTTTYSYENISPSDNMKVYIYMSSSNEIPVKIKVLNNGVSLTEDEYVFDSHGFTFDDSTREWSTSTNRNDKSTIKFNVGTDGYYALKYTLPGGVVGSEYISVNRDGKNIPLPYGEDRIIKLGYVESTEQFTISISNTMEGDYYKNGFAIIKQETAGLGCDNLGFETTISVVENGTSKYYFPYVDVAKTNSNPSRDYSIAHSGYMYRNTYSINGGSLGSNYYYGTGFTYEDGVYKLTDPVKGFNGTHHYTCGSTNASASCDKIRYYIESYYYLLLENGDSINDYITKSNENNIDSNAKSIIDTWYSDSINNYTSKLEDTIFCNDRTIVNYSFLDPTGGATSGTAIRAKYNERNANYVNLNCTNINDSFGVNVGNKKLTYPVALLTSDEYKMAGGSTSSNSNFYLSNTVHSWLLSPAHFSSSYGAYNLYMSKYSLAWFSVEHEHGFRPVISLKPGQLIKSGTGTATDPYILK